MSMNICVLKRGDEDLLTNVAEGVFDNDVRSALVSKFLSDDRHHIAVAIDAGVVIGFASAVHYVHPDKSAEMWINEVSVAPSYRRRGVGRALLQELFKVSRALGRRQAWVATERSNIAAMKLYASMGGCKPPRDSVIFEFDL